MATVKMFRGDLKPDYRVRLTFTDPDSGVTGPVNLTTALSIRVIGRISGAVVINRTEGVVGTPAGVVTMPWLAGETDTVGILESEVEVMWPGNKPQTFRPKDTITFVQDWA